MFFDNDYIMSASGRLSDVKRRARRVATYLMLTGLNEDWKLIGDRKGMLSFSLFVAKLIRWARDAKRTVVSRLIGLWSGDDKIAWPLCTLWRYNDPFAGNDVLT